MQNRKKSFFLGGFPEMGFKQQSNCSRDRKLVVYLVFAILSIVLLRLCFHPLISIEAPPLEDSAIIVIPNSPPPPPLPYPEQENQEAAGNNDERLLCDYTNGEWVRDEMGPLYNGTTCGTIKESQKCISHGRPDFDYLYWKWKPDQCDIPRFDPTSFLLLLRDKHLAFVGDSMARNQLESLLCMLSTFSTPDLIYRNGEDNKFRKWRFNSHNVTVSVYWSPFLVKGREKSVERDLDHNELYLDSVDEKWARDLDKIDVIVLSIGHWFLHPAVYFESGSVIGCHSCGARNYTEIGFYEVFRKAIRTTLKAITERSRLHHYDVFLTTFSPSHFEGRPWDSLDACNMTSPYRRKVVEGMDAEMRRTEMEEIEIAAKMNINVVGGGGGMRIEALDVTGLSLQRPDGHPGPYMYANPFKEGVQEKVHNDCLHWCLPGPVDTWNQIMLEVCGGAGGLDIQERNIS